MSSNKYLPPKGISLRAKILIPYFVILLILGSAATIGTILIINDTLEHTADKRLSAFQQQIYFEIRELEERLLRRVNLLEISYRIDRLFGTSATAELPEIEELITESLVAEGVTARYISPKEASDYPDKNLLKLLELARISNKSQIRFTTNIGHHPALTVVRPLLAQETIIQYIVIQATVDTAYLNKISTPLNLKTALFDLTGTFLVGSEQGHSFPAPSPESMTKILDGQRVFSSQGNLLKNRNLFYAIPLGTTDMLIVLLEMPLTDISSIVSALATRSAISIFIALLVGSYIYYRIIRQITTPTENMVQAAKAVGEGDFDYRINHIPDGELGGMVVAFNRMMQNISDLYVEKVNNERDLTKAQEELKYKNIVEEKNRAIEKANQEMSSHLKELSTLLQLNQAMASTLELDLLFERFITSLNELLDCQMVSLMLYNPAKEQLEISHTLGIDVEILNDVSFGLNEGISGEVAQTHQSIYVEDLKTDSRYMNYKGKLPAVGSMLSVPLLSKDRLCGVLNLHKITINGFSPDEIKLARAVANQAAVAIENTQLYEQAKEQSITDELTGLANRRHFQDILHREIVHAKRYATNISMIMVDIDHFKNYNDTHGHLQGDIALKKVAQELLQNTRGIDLVARFGGEEFIILLPKTTITGARITAEKLRQRIELEIFDGEKASQPGGKMTISLGIATFPDTTEKMEQLLEHADQALFKAKESGRNRVVIWDESLKAAI